MGACDTLTGTAATSRFGPADRADLFSLVGLPRYHGEEAEADGDEAWGFERLRFGPPQPLWHLGELTLGTWARNLVRFGGPTPMDTSRWWLKVKDAHFGTGVN